MPQSVLDCALEYSARGLSVFPLMPNEKRPVGPWARYQRNRASDDELEAMFSDDALNIGIAQGPVSGCFVVDIDGPEGEESWSKLCQRHEFETPTATAKTGKGRHLYFRIPKGATVRNAQGILPGVDIRGEGGYVVAPPSVHPDGSTYEWVLHPDDEEMAAAPDWLVTLVSGSQSHTDAPTSAKPIDPAYRDEAGKLDTSALWNEATRGASWREPVMKLVGHWKAIGWTNDQIFAQASALTRFDKTNLQTGVAYTESDTIDDLRAFMGGRAQDWGQNGLSMAESGFSVGGERTLNPFTTLSLAKCQPQFSNEYFWKGIIQPAQISILWEGSQEGKTFFALSLMAHLASVEKGGGLFLNRRTKKARVLYISAEGGAEDLNNRISAIKAQHQINAADLEIITTPVAIDSKEQLQRLCDTIISSPSFPDGKADIIVIDTASACLFDSDENSKSEVAQILAELRIFADEIGRPHIMIVHHTGHQKDRERGAYAWRANPDVSLSLQLNSSTMTGTVTAHKVRSGRQGILGGYALKPMELGDDDDGDKVSTLVAIEADPAHARTDKRKARQRMTPEQKAWWNALQIAFHEMGELKKPHPEMPEVLTIMRSPLYAILRREGLFDADNRAVDSKTLEGPTAKAERDKLRTKLSGFEGRGLIGFDKEHVWLVDADEHQNFLFKIDESGEVTN